MEKLLKKKKMDHVTLECARVVRPFNCIFDLGFYALLMVIFVKLHWKFGEEMRCTVWMGPDFTDEKNLREAYQTIIRFQWRSAQKMIQNKSIASRMNQMLLNRFGARLFTELRIRFYWAISATQLHRIELVHWIERKNIISMQQKSSAELNFVYYKETSRMWINACRWHI